MKRIIWICTLLLGTMLLLTGCTAKKIFVSPDEQYKLVPLRDNELKNDIYYVKDGAKFFATYTPDGKDMIAGAYAKDSYYWLTKDSTLIPTLYSDELIAFASQKVTNLKTIELKRYYDVGYSLGIFGGSFDSDGYYCVNLDKNMVAKSSAYKAFKSASSKDIRIVSVNDMPVDKKMLNDGGIFKDLKQGETVELGYYSGTYFKTAIVEADYYFLQAYETMQVSQVQSTKNGYLAIMMPEDAKSGYYKLKDGGMFKYYAYEKGDKVDNEENMNEQYLVKDETNSLEYAQQFSLSVGSQMYNMIFSLEYQETSVNEEDINITLVSPLGTQYELTGQNGLASITLPEVAPGKWIIYAYPENMVVTNIDAMSAAQDPNAKKEEFVFEVTGNEVNKEFYCIYAGKGMVWGTVENEFGEAQVLEKRRASGSDYYMGTTYAYLPKGTYKVTVYHYMDTVITEVNKRTDTGNEEDEIINVVD